ncbi:exodeoxyribonuclease III [Secundilactobacillus folii]|uniref:Exodeoxyribonuclease III n=1 Tax=Secundilactobacillus folii TaxID=2678357 RepID=A0A7X2XY34_9LACO|nr:exodeoxyribonuclease III [Secundilactobacillus folii]
MKFISWNVNGLRAAVRHDFMTTFKDLNADFFCVQETKMQPDQLTLDLPGYQQYFNSAERKGYSGTAVFTKYKPLNVTYDIGVSDFDHEGRVITLEYQDFFLVTCYTPNSGTGLKRLDFRMGWEAAFQDYLDALNAKKPVILCGDLNVAHEEIDIRNPKTNHKNAGFTDQEREQFTHLLKRGYTDTFRYFYPDATDKYSWWSYRFNARDRNAGWRIDYFVTSDTLRPKLASAGIKDQIYGSDHCPIFLTTSDLHV